MKFTHLMLIAVLAAVPGCKIVFESDQETTIPEGPEGDNQRNAARLEETFDSQLLPRITGTAVTVAVLKQRLASDGMDALGAEIGNQGSGVGAAWNFSLTDSGTVVAAKLDTSARTVDVDTDGDQKPDLRVQLGPVIRGTALRDVAPFYVFDDFRDQIEFAKLARAVNNRVKASLTIPDGDLIGQTVTFTGVVALKSPKDSLVLTPISVEFTP
ncbi:DUF2291 domain-containing protein [Tropicibacter sp. R15_0]|uniref:DUF2291 family protein n=1 Tax=Tropicibacter sp. R15_0 TaxID=2821101 RepID=UPI001ADB4372|nr:DUF2291 domain-containing protein [Tropicibacter sp. R15_0]MBO9467790.1 DUF2291 domain-containing protein [Tropicibacter sp. R15_0]